jgi:NAD-dependent dihydropyrimidine dehydrogenase PreA subunit
MLRPRIILSARETPDALSAMEQGVVEQLRDRGLGCLLMPNLYHLVEASDLWTTLASRLKNAVLLGWLYPRPAEWLLQRHRIAGRRLTILDLGSFADADAAVGAVLAAISEGPKLTAKSRQRVGKIERLAEPIKPRWYPIIDGSRCINCQHCLQFCLFGVYELNAEGKVTVCRPDQCKPGCPACSRICPKSAIMFPLYEKDAAIAGAPGTFVAVDAAARKMFATRTRKPWSAGVPPVDEKAGETAASSTAGETPALRPTFDDLDELVDRLDQQMQRRR